MFDFTTGPSLLLDVGELRYNGVLFSPLFETNIVGNAVKDEARRTVKLMEYVLTADGYVTLLDGRVDISSTMATLRRDLEVQGAHLVYRGRGFDLDINAPGADVNAKDAAWGPVPEVMEFQPLGAGRSAKVKWKVTVRVPEVPAGFLRRLLLQLNYEATVSYDEAGYSHLDVRGSLEIPLTRVAPGNRTVATTADAFRFALEERILTGVDLTRFRVTRREFKFSRDKRTMEWDVGIDEKPYMDLPPACTVAHGSFNTRPAKAGMGLVQWMCTLRATYTVRADAPRRVAWVAFLGLLRLRMKASSRGFMLPGNVNQNPPAAQWPFPELPSFGSFVWISALGFRELQQAAAAAAAQDRRAFLIDFSFDEGLYLDSGTVSFSATWKLMTTFSHILLASGLWKKVAENDPAGKNLWAMSVRDIQGVNSWLQNQLDPSLDVIVDFGSPG